MSKATDPHKNIGDKTVDPAGDQPEPAAPAPAGYFTTPEPAPVFGPQFFGTEPVAASAVSPERETDADTAAGQRSTGTTTTVRHPVRVGTVVWGAVVLVLGILIILSSQLDLHLNAGMTSMWLLFGAGVAMLAGGAINLLRRTRP